jgi:hypothetical protein
MSLVDFMKEKEAYRNKLITEMSLRLDDDTQDILNKIDKNLEFFDYIKRVGDEPEKVNIGNNIFDMYNYGKHTAEKSIAFLSDRYTVALVDFKLFENGIQIIFTNLFRPFRRVMDKIFIEYLLPKYGNIYSDAVQTTSAFNFWQRLVNEKSLHDTKYKVCIVDQDSGEEKEITHGDEMITTYGYDTRYYAIIYKLQKI